MAKNYRKNNNTNVKEIRDAKEEKKPTLKEGNYLIEVIKEGKVTRKILVTGSEINITKLNDGGLTVDLI